MWNRYSLKLGALGEAAEAAFVLRDIDALSRLGAGQFMIITHLFGHLFICMISFHLLISDRYLFRVESLAGGDSHLLDKVAGFKARLHAGMR